MKVAIIGAGNVGKALGTSITRAGHDVTIAAQHPEHAQAAATGSARTPADSNAAAVAEGGRRHPRRPVRRRGRTRSRAEIRGGVAGKTIIDVTNPLRPDFSGLATEDTSAAEEFQQQLPEANVVKAFNTIFASNQADPSRGDRCLRRRRRREGEAAGHLAGRVDGLQRRSTSARCSTARYLEGMAFINIGLNAQNGWSWTSAWHLER